MKKLFLLLSAVSFFATSCVEDYDDGGYSNVSAGIYIYYLGATTNSLSLDGLSVATRLGILLEEMEYQGIEVPEGSDQNWSELDKFIFPLNSTSYNIKNFLMGTDELTVISRDGDQFKITYGDPDSTTSYSSGTYDSYRRRGSFIVDTKGVMLSNTTTDNPWTISVYGESMEYASDDSNSTVAEVTYSNTELYSKGVGSFAYVLNGFEGYFSIDEDIRANWSGSGSFIISDFKNLTVDELLGSTYSLTVSPNTGGMSLNGVEVSYATGGLTSDVSAEPLVLSPSTNGYGYVSGSEQVAFTGAYDEEYFDVTSVSVKWYENAATVTYGDYKYSM